MFAFLFLRVSQRSAASANNQVESVNTTREGNARLHAAFGTARVQNQSRTFLLQRKAPSGKRFLPPEVVPFPAAPVNIRAGGELRTVRCRCAAAAPPGRPLPRDPAALLRSAGPNGRSAPVTAAAAALSLEGVCCQPGNCSELRVCLLLCMVLINFLSFSPLLLLIVLFF